jgi:hypothetical protein
VTLASATATSFAGLHAVGPNRQTAPSPTPLLHPGRSGTKWSRSPGIDPIGPTSPRVPPPRPNFGQEARLPSPSPQDGLNGGLDAGTAVVGSGAGLHPASPPPREIPATPPGLGARAGPRSSSPVLTPASRTPRLSLFASGRSHGFSPALGASAAASGSSATRSLATTPELGSATAKVLSSATFDPLRADSPPLAFASSPVPVESEGLSRAGGLSRGLTGGAPVSFARIPSRAGNPDHPSETDVFPSSSFDAQEALDILEWNDEHPGAPKTAFTPPPPAGRATPHSGGIATPSGSDAPPRGEDATPKPVATVGTGPASALLSPLVHPGYNYTLQRRRRGIQARATHAPPPIPSTPVRNLVLLEHLQSPNSAFSPVSPGGRRAHRQTGGLDGAAFPAAGNKRAAPAIMTPQTPCRRRSRVIMPTGTTMPRAPPSPAGAKPPSAAGASSSPAERMPLSADARLHSIFPLPLTSAASRASVARDSPRRALFAPQRSEEPLRSQSDVASADPPPRLLATAGGRQQLLGSSSLADSSVSIVPPEAHSSQPSIPRVSVITEDSSSDLLTDP